MAEAHENARLGLLRSLAMLPSKFWLEGPTCKRGGGVLENARLRPSVLVLKPRLRGGVAIAPPLVAAK